jgi:Rad3-related DNA helicase
MTEGVDLSDALSRFQIICKTPYPYLGDAVTQKKMQLNPDWYPYQTAKTLIQALGRSVRSEEDFAVSYILDSDFSYFYKRNDRFFPEDFERTLRF